jgi:hypothetical protein
LPTDFLDSHVETVLPLPEHLDVAFKATKKFQTADRLALGTGYQPRGYVVVNEAGACCLQLIEGNAKHQNGATHDVTVRGKAPKWRTTSRKKKWNAYGIGPVLGRALPR